jgi:hypothetical protein
MANKRPIIETKVLTEFGEVLEDSNFWAATVGADLSYVPGYSDMRRTRDQEIARIQSFYGATPGSDEQEAARHRELRKVAPLPVRLQWTRSMRVSGSEPDSTKEIQAGNDGYRTVMQSDIGKDWLRELPPGAKIVAGGQIRKGDVTLMVCEQSDAARNAARNHVQVMREVQDLSKRPLMKFSEADPNIESKLGDKPIGQA